jgi:flavin-dependent dehydrogenase
MVMRSDLAARMVKSAVEAGTALHDGEAVRGVEQTELGFIVSTAGGRYQSRFLIGADGATGVVRRSLGIERRSEQGVALECEVEVPDEVHRRYARTAVFDVEAAPDGYGWIFPKTTHLSVGLGSMKPAGLPMVDLLRRFLLRYDLVDGGAVGDVAIHTHPLPVATSGERARAGNALLAGDAAGVADGFGGEGVCYSIASGELAAQTVSRALAGDARALDAYEEELDRSIRSDHGFSNLMGRIVRRFPDPGYRILTSLGEGKAVLIPLLLGEIGFGEALRRLPRLLALDRSQRQTTGES